MNVNCTICNKSLLGLQGLELHVGAWMLIEQSETVNDPSACHVSCLRRCGEFEMWAGVVVDFYRRTSRPQIVADSPTAIALVNSAADKCAIYSTKGGQTGFHVSQLPPAPALDEGLAFSLKRYSYLNTTDPNVNAAIQSRLLADGYISLAAVLQLLGLEACYDMDSYSVTNSRYLLIPEYQTEWRSHVTKCQLEFEYSLAGDTASLAKVAIPRLRWLPPRSAS